MRLPLLLGGVLALLALLGVAVVAGDGTRQVTTIPVTRPVVKPQAEKEVAAPPWAAGQFAVYVPAAPAPASPPQSQAPPAQPVAPVPPPAARREPAGNPSELRHARKTPD